MLKDTGHFNSPNAAKYLEQLCKHFAHKVEVTRNEDSSTVDFVMGPSTLTASDTVLTIEVSGSNAEELGEAREVIDKHLARFAHREGFDNMDWQGV